MQRLAIFTLLLITAAGWMALQQQRLAAFQTEPQAQQSVEAGTADAAAAPQTNAAQPPVAEPPPPDPAVVAAAEKLLRDARDRLYDVGPDRPVRSVRAKFIERANFGNRRFVAEGTYLSGTFPALRLEYRVQIGGSEGELVEVCDGNILRTSKVIRPIDGDSKEPTLSQWTRKDIAQIIGESSVGGTPEAAVLQAELSLGGVPTLLASLERTMIFDTFREQVWQSRPTTIIEGRWRPEILRNLAGQMGASAQSLAQLMPDRVRIYFDKETQFPTRILYRKLVARNPDVYVSLLSMEFTDIRLNEGFDPEEFRYPPPKGVDEIDETAVYLKLIEGLRAMSQPPAATQPIDATDAGAPRAEPQSPPADAPVQQPATP